MDSVTCTCSPPLSASMQRLHSLKSWTHVRSFHVATTIKSVVFGLIALGERDSRTTDRCNSLHPHPQLQLILFPYASIILDHHGGSLSSFSRPHSTLLDIQSWYSTQDQWLYTSHEYAGKRPGIPICKPSHTRMFAQGKLVKVFKFVC